MPNLRRDGRMHHSSSTLYISIIYTKNQLIIYRIVHQNQKELFKSGSHYAFAIANIQLTLNYIQLNLKYK